MNTSSCTLVVGATGLLGQQVVKLLAPQASVRALIRRSAGEEKMAELRDTSAGLVFGDLKERASLVQACQGVRTVISTASSSLSRQPDDSLRSVDEQGQLALIDAAERARAEHFVFVSFPPNELDFELQRAKRMVEERLRESRLSFCILQPSYFIEVWLGPALGFEPARGSVRVMGDGTGRVSWISLHDVARFVVAAATDPAFAGKTLQLGGPEDLSMLEVIRICEELGATIRPDFVDAATLEQQYANPRDELEQTYAALQLTTARGQVIDATPALSLLPHRPSTVREYLTHLLQAP